MYLGPTIVRKSGKRTRRSSSKLARASDVCARDCQTVRRLGEAAISEINRRPRRVTASDVARAAGVSRATVGFVMNSTPGQKISQTTRQRVLATAAALGYEPSAEARNLRRGHSDVVLLHLPVEVPLNADIGPFIEHLSARLADEGLTLLVHPWSAQAGDAMWPVITPVALIAWHLDERVVEAMQRQGVRVIISLANQSDPFARWLAGDRETAIASAQIETFRAAGHRRLAYGAPHDARLTSASVSRFDALSRACAAWGDMSITAQAVPLMLDDAAQVILAWRALPQAVTGVCAHDDISALAVLAGLRALELTSPRDMAIVGVGDSFAAQLADPPLTMVDVDWRATARWAAEVVSALLAGTEPSDPPGVTRLLRRGSL